MTFLDQEKRRYATIKSDLWPGPASEAGTYRGRARSFCLADGYSAENLNHSLRDEAIAYFRTRQIGWHDGWPDNYGHKNGLPSNHLCSSQVACVNTLFPLTQNADLLADTFRPFFPELAEPLPFTEDGRLSDGSIPFLGFEWIGTENYLGEVSSRSRGAHTTSADFAFRFRHSDGRRHLVLGEWKYTERYGKKPPISEKINKTRLRAYRQAFERWQTIQPELPDYHTFFAEPFYQLMRLTLLAQAIERRGGDGQMTADVVSVLVIVPQANRDYRDNLAATPALTAFGRTVSEAWQALAPPGRFDSLSTEHLLTTIATAGQPSHRDWVDYLGKRYGWSIANTA